MTAKTIILVKLSNFGLFASAACIMPFISTYFLFYTNATYGDFGKLNLVASILSSLISFMSISMTDCRKAHRPIYLASLLFALLSFISLTCPLVINSTRAKTESVTVPNELIELNVSKHILMDDAKHHLVSMNFSSTLEPNLASEYEDYASGGSDWSHFICSCLLMGSMAFSVSLHTNNLMNINVSLNCQIDKLLDSIQIWSCLGWILGSLALLSISHRFGIMSILFTSLILYTILATFNLLTSSLFWPKDLAKMVSNVRFNPDPRGARFKFDRKFWFKTRTLSNCENNLSMTTKGNLHNCGDIVVTKFSRTSLFDSRDEDLFRNIRRCSLAPLGDSFVIKQFELDNNNAHHFYHHVTKIEPRGRNISDVPTIEYNIQNIHQLPDFCLQCAGSRKVGLLLSLRLIGMLWRRNKLIMSKYLILIATNGFLVAMNWYYLFPYLAWLGVSKFGLIATSINIAVGLSELLFCLVRPQFTKSVGHSTSLSLISILYGLRYSLYLVFIVSYKSISPEMIVLVELLYAAARSWFCSVNVSLVLEFARLAGDCVPELIELDFIDNTKEAIDRFNEGARLIMFSLSACCFNGLGLAFGSLIGGWLIDNYGFTTLWVASASAAYLTGFVNILIDLIDYYKNR